jgi:hypothetical protein
VTRSLEAIDADLRAASDRLHDLLAADDEASAIDAQDSIDQLLDERESSRRDSGAEPAHAS